MYATSGDGNVYAFDARTGDSTWKTFIGGWSDSWAFSNNFILTSAKQGYAIAAIRVSDGSIAWQYPVVGTSNGLAISPDESLFATGNIVGSAPNTAVFDASGSLLWAVPENADALVFSGNGKYLLTEVAGSENPAEPADHLHLYDAQTGEELWSQPLVEPWAGWNHENGVLYVSDDALMILVGSQNNGYVYFFKGQTSGAPGAPTSLIRPRPVQR
jgi:outer membrane protein assembly factor BamB